jgi:FixJ family two-component response regulator
VPSLAKPFEVADLIEQVRAAEPERREACKEANDTEEKKTRHQRAQEHSFPVRGL